MTIAKRKPAAPRSRPVFETEIFLTNRCNLACSYCSSRHLRDDSEAQRLDFSQLKRFVDLVSSDRTIREEFSGPVRIEFAGGEPLMEFELLRSTVDYIRSRRLDFEISIATNGTLLTPARVDYLVDKDVDIRVSLDGLKPVNDRHRVFAHDRSKSVFDAVMKNLASCFPTPRHRARCNLSPTLNPANVHTLPGVVDFFGRELGVWKLRVGLEAFCAWTPAEVSRFRLALRRLVRGRLALLRPGARPEDLAAVFDELPLRQDVRCYADGSERPVSTLALLYDGHFYPSPDFVVAPPPPERRYRVGSLARGIDFAKLGRVFRPLLADIDRYCEYRSGPRSPVEGYYWALVNGYPAGEARRVLRSTSEVNRAFHEEAGGYLRLRRAFLELAGDPGFGDLAHPPKYRGPRGLDALRLEGAAPGGGAALRAAADYCLYAPGGRKSLSFPGPVPGAAAYALAKAALLGGRLRLDAVATEASS